MPTARMRSMGARGVRKSVDGRRRPAHASVAGRAGPPGRARVDVQDCSARRPSTPVTVTGSRIRTRRSAVPHHLRGTTQPFADRGLAPGCGSSRRAPLHSGLVGGSVDQDAMPREDFSMPPPNRTRPSSITRMRSYTSHRFASRRIEVGHQLTQEKQPARRRRDGQPDAGARGHGADLCLAVHTGLLQGRQPGCSGSPGTSAPAPSSYGVSCPHLRRGPEARTQDAFACSRPPPFAATTAR